MIRIVKGANHPALKAILVRGDVRFDKEEAIVKSVIARVKREGDRALFAFSKQFDKTVLTPRSIRVQRPELVKQAALCDTALKRAVDTAIANIRKYHSYQKAPEFAFSPASDIELAQRTLAIENVAVYIPGGHVPLFSSVLMTVIPAQAAGVKRLVLATPPRKEGFDPAMAYSLLKLGVREVYRMGGAQAIAALAFGTKSVKRVDKIVGPGNNYVSLAKKLLYGVIDIDMIAGPSEILVIADKSANPAFIARDLLSQSEHGSGSESSVLLTVDADLARAVQSEVNALIAGEPATSPIRRALQQYGLIMVLKDLEECVAVANRIAPEHLEIMTRTPRTLLQGIRNAGAVFLGSYTCESLGDYFAGPSHVLPTNGTARFFSPLSAYHFMKRMSVIEFGAKAARTAAPHVMRMAGQERLAFHAEAARIRS